MKLHMLSIFVLFVVGLSAHAVVAPPAFAPPVSVKQADQSLFPMARAQVESYLAHLAERLVLDAYAGQNDALRASGNEAKGLPMAAGMPLDIRPPELWSSVFQDGGQTVYLASLTSTGALALRLIVDLSGLESGEEIWAVDPASARAFGPYTAANAVSGGAWLPTIEGDTAVLMARTSSSHTPQVAVLGLSHFYRSFAEAQEGKLLSCNINIACETDSVIQSVSTGVGIIVIPSADYDSAMCTGTLINNPDTTTLEPYFITANHCITSQWEATQIDVVWDYRATACGSSSAPALSSLPRSTGESLLATSATLDISLLELDSVASGTLGRTYAGYSTEALQAGDAVITMGHADGSHMRIAYGEIVDTDLARYDWLHQNKVHWDDGVTEDGSSGSGLFLASAGYVLVGCLSNGPTHSCSDNTGNMDYFSSFASFYSSVSQWLSGTSTPGDCPASKALKNSPYALAGLRAFRDNGLLRVPGGGALVAGYYAAAPMLNTFIQQYGSAHSAFTAACMPFAWMGHHLDH